jgi:hypothetical protein
MLAAAALGLLLGIAASSSLNQTLILGPLAAILRAVRPATAEPSSGAVERVATFVESKGRSLGDCVDAEVARWAFPLSSAAHEITFPLIMQPLLTASGIPSAKERRRLED